MEKKRTIALEEHYILPEFANRIPAKQMHGHDESIQAKLSDVGEARLKSMDENGIDVQVLSWAAPGADRLPAEEGLVFARDVNNEIAKKIALHPTRFSAFAHLPMTSPAGAAMELKRAVEELGFCGAMINGMTSGKFLDDESFSPILTMAERLQVPLYLHPALPDPLIQKHYYSGLPNGVGEVLMGPGFGWHIEVAIHVLRLVTSGTLEKYRGLRLIIGHMGETLPFMMARADQTMPRELTKLERTVGETLRQQVYLTTSGFFTMPPLMNALETFGVNRILFSVDYPYANNERGREFLAELPLLTSEIDQISGRNAERLLKLK